MPENNKHLFWDTDILKREKQQKIEYFCETAKVEKLARPEGVRGARAKSVGIKRIARKLSVGTGTVQRIVKEAA